MSQRISSFQIGTIFYQSGYGYPTHIATKGCTYIDIDTGTMYINKDGIVDWEEFLDSTTPISGGGTFTGGTVSGATIFTNGLTANTFSASTYLGLPTDIRVTGGTYSSGSATFTNNTGGTFSVTGFDARSPSSLPNITASGTDTYTATFSGVTAYTDSDTYLVRFTNGNTTVCTLNINSLGAIPLYRNNDGQLLGGDINDGSEMLCIYNSSLNVFQCIGVSPNSLFAYVTNADSVTITKGMPVYAFSGTGDRMTVKRALNTSDLTSAQTVGLVYSSSIATNQKGLIMIQGLLDGLSNLPTATWSDGNPVYLGATNGSITNVKPYAPNHLVYLGVVTTASNGAAGRMYVRVQNGYELDELHNVVATGATYGDLIVYSASGASNLWVRTKTLTGNYTVNGGLTITGTTTTNTLSATTITLPFSSGSTLFAGTSGQISQNNSQFFWDNVNNRLGIGTNTPATALQVTGGDVLIDNNKGYLAKITSGSNLSLLKFDTSNNCLIGSNFQGGATNIYATTNILFYSYPSSVLTEQMRIVGTTGNVLIGTTTDGGYKLNVNGTGRISGDTTIVGKIIQSSTAYTGTHTIEFNANNSVRFTNSGIGSYMTAGPSNVVAFDGQNLQAVQRGATFGTTVAATGIVSITAMAAQSSGVINSSALQFTHPINNTGTYSGITRGIYYNPTLTSLVGTTHRAIETVTGDIVLGSTSGSVLIGKTSNDGYKLDVSGTTRLSALTQNILTVIGSGNSTTSPIFSVQGSQGELFSVTDSLTGSLFSVNDISGLPILEVFSDNTTLMGNYLAPSLNTTTRVTLTAGTNTIYSIPVSAYTGAFFDYTLISTGTTGARAGTITSIWSGTSVQYTETSTNDIGVTSNVTFSVTSNGTLAQLSSSATTSGWIVKTIVRGI